MSKATRKSSWTVLQSQMMTINRKKKKKIWIMIWYNLGRQIESSSFQFEWNDKQRREQNSHVIRILIASMDLFHFVLVFDLYGVFFSLLLMWAQAQSTSSCSPLNGIDVGFVWTKWSILKFSKCSIKQCAFVLNAFIVCCWWDYCCAPLSYWRPYEFSLLLKSHHKWQMTNVLWFRRTIVFYQNQILDMFGFSVRSCATSTTTNPSIKVHL